ncbi:MAG TPA: TRAP transporter substrate-binding protein DctP [Sediminispirochaeta sp.]|nr:TRAP transporter substrate-binding protein DctP [Sediminispirochaeta sp.]
MGSKLGKVIIFLFVLSLLNLSLLFAGGQGEEGTEGKISIKMSYNGPADEEKNAVHYFASHFKNILAEKTDGQIVVVLYPDSQLGDEEQRIEMVMNDPFINVASYAGVGTVFPELFAANIPFMFDNYAAGNWFFDNSEFWKKAQTEFKARTGAELVCAVEEGGFLAFTNSKRPIRSPRDFKGLTFRAMDDSQVALYKSFGASGTPIPWTEVYTALQTGVADGQMNPPMYIIIGSLYEVQDYMTLANIQYSMQYLTINGEWIDSLSPELRLAVYEAAYEANQLTREDVESRVEERTRFIADQGVEVYAPNQEEMKQFRELGQPSFIEWLRGRIDEQWVDLAISSAEEANKRFGQ